MMVRRKMTAHNFKGMMRPLHQKIYRQEEREETRARRTQVSAGLIFLGVPKVADEPTNPYKVAGDF